MLKVRHSLLAVLILVANFVWAYPMVPNPVATYGVLCTATEPDFDEYRYAESIAHCRRNVSRDEKTKIYRDYGISEKCRGRYTIDHFIPLSLGGNNDVENLWPEHKNVKALRPKMELELYAKLRDGKLTRDKAVQIIIEAKLNPKFASLPASVDACDTPDSISSF